MLWATKKKQDLSYELHLFGESSSRTLANEVVKGGGCNVRPPTRWGPLTTIFEGLVGWKNYLITRGAPSCMILTLTGDCLGSGFWRGWNTIITRVYVRVDNNILISINHPGFCGMWRFLFCGHGSTPIFYCVLICNIYPWKLQSKRFGE